MSESDLLALCQYRTSPDVQTDGVQAPVHTPPAIPDPDRLPNGYQQLAETAVPRLADQLADTFQGLLGLAAADRANLDRITSEVARACREIGSVHGEMSSLRESAKALSETLEALTAKLAENQAGLGKQEEERRKLAADVQRLLVTQENDRVHRAGLVSDLTEGLRRLEQDLLDHSSSIESRMASDAAERVQIGQRLEALTETANSRANVAIELRDTVSRIQELQASISRRLDEQGEAVRALQVTTREHANRWAKLFAILQESQPETNSAPAFRQWP